MRRGTRTQRRWFSVAPRRSAHLRFQRLRLSVRGRILYCDYIGMNKDNYNCSNNLCKRIINNYNC